MDVRLVLFCRGATINREALFLLGSIAVTGGMVLTDLCRLAACKRVRRGSRAIVCRLIDMGSDPCRGTARGEEV